MITLFKSFIELTANITWPLLLTLYILPTLNKAWIFCSINKSLTCNYIAKQCTTFHFVLYLLFL